jgi:hypothetical protein
MLLQEGGLSIRFELTGPIRPLAKINDRYRAKAVRLVAIILTLNEANDLPPCLRSSNSIRSVEFLFWLRQCSLPAQKHLEPLAGRE